MKIEIHPRAEADIIRQFRYYLVDPGRARGGISREAVIESVEQLKPHPRMGTRLSARGQNSSWQAQRAPDFKAGK